VCKWKRHVLPLQCHCLKLKSAYSTSYVQFIYSICRSLMSRSFLISFRRNYRDMLNFFVFIPNLKGLKGL